MLPSFRWKIVFNVIPGLQNSETIGGYTFEVRKDGRTVVEKVFPTDRSDTSPSEERLHVNEREAKVLSRGHADRIRNLLLRRMVYQRSFAPIDVTPLESLTLLNEQELRSAGIPLVRRITVVNRTAYGGLDVGDSLAESEEFWTSGSQSTGDERGKEILRIADWLERSAREDDPIQSFILAWIGFNGLYGLFSEEQTIKGSDADKFECMLSALIAANQAVEIRHNIVRPARTLATNEIRSESKQTDFSALLDATLRSTDLWAQDGIKLTTRCIYGVRKQVFHEAPQPSAIRESAQAARAAMMPIATACLKSIINNRKP